MKTMLDILKERLPEGLEIIKEKGKASASQTEITFRYQGIEEKSWLPKTCAPGCAEKVCDQTIACTMWGFGLKMQDMEMVEHWHSAYLQTITKND